MKLNELKNKVNKTSNFKTIYKLERKLNLKSLFVFTLISVALLVLVVGLYPVFETMLQNLDNPQFLLNNDLISYYNAQVSQQWILLPLIYAAYVGYNLVVNNFRSGSSVILYTQNLSREKIIGAKLLRLILNILILNIVSAAAGFVTLSIINFNAVNIVNFLIFTLMLTVVSLVMAFLMFGLSLIYLKKISPFISIALPIILIFVSSIGLMVETVDFLKYASPTSIIRAEGAGNVLVNGFSSVNLIALAIWGVISLVSLLAGYISFKRKDLI